MSTAGLIIAVNHWGSHPDLENDDCYCGEDFTSEAEAVAYYHQDPGQECVEYIEIDIAEEDCIRLGIERCRKNPKFRPSFNEDTDEWRREQANEAGMLGGIHAYNDAMGYDSEEYEP
jgi:hypothetical protein